MPRSKSPIKARLEQWHLKRVPFPTVPFVEPYNVDPLRNGSVFVSELRTEEIESFRNNILGAGYTDMVKVWSWMWARKHMGVSVGMGKTAFLTHIAKQINQDYGHAFFDHAAHWLVVYVPVQSKTKSVGDLLTLILDSFCRELHGVSAERLLLARLRHKVITLGRYGEHTIPRGAVIGRFGQDRWLSEHGIDIIKLRSTVETFLIEQGVSKKVAQAIADCSMRAYLQVLNGNETLIPPRSQLASNAFSLLLNDVARAVYAASMLHVTFLLDDFYHLVRTTKPIDRPDLAADLRSIAVDGAYFSTQHNLYNWVGVMHTLTAPTFNDAWKKRDMHLIAPLDINAPSSVILKPLSLHEGPILLEAYLEYQRPSRSQSKGYPFTADGLQSIVRIARQNNTPGNAGETQTALRDSLRAAFEVTTAGLFQKDDPAPIGPAFVEYVLSGKPLPEIEDSDSFVPPSEEATPLAIVCPCSCHDDEEAVAHDVIALLAGGKDQDSPPAVIGHRCSACNMLVEIAQ